MISYKTDQTEDFRKVFSMCYIKYLKKTDLLLGFQACFTLSLRDTSWIQLYERRPGNNICSFLGDIFVIFDKTATQLDLE